MSKAEVSGAGDACKTAGPQDLQTGIKMNFLMNQKQNTKYEAHTKNMAAEGCLFKRQV